MTEMILAVSLGAALVILAWRSTGRQADAPVTQRTVEAERIIAQVHPTKPIEPTKDELRRARDEELRAEQDARELADLSDASEKAIADLIGEH